VDHPRRFRFKEAQKKRAIMQFLVYLTVLMVAISTVLLEVHWLTSPAPQPKPAIQASAPPPPKTEGPNQALSPIYPKKLAASRPAEPGNSQAPNASPNTVQTTSPTAPGSSTSKEQSAAATMVAPTQPLAPPAQATQLSPPPPPPSPPAQQSATAQTTRPVVTAERATPPQQAQTAPPQESSAPPSGANAAPQQKPLRETTGAAVREDNTRQVAADSTNASNRNDNPQQTAQGSSSNRCDVQACAGAYRSFRASDCTYQPFDGVRRLCEKSPGQRIARERDQPERRRWSGDAEARSLDRPTSGRRIVDEGDDVAADFDDARREPLGFFLFGRRPRW
jgi:hypothetical protein